MVLAWVLLLVINGFESGHTTDYRDLRLDGLKQFQAGHFAEAKSLLDTALDLAMRGSDTYAVALIKEALGDVYQNEFDLTKAEQAYTEAATILRGQPEHSHALAITLVNLGAVISGQRRFCEALNAYAEVSTLAKRSSLDDPQLDLELLNGLGVIYFNQGQLKKAEVQFARAIKVRPSGNDLTLDVAKVLNNLATIYSSKHDYQKSADSYTRALELTEQALGSSHPNLTFLLGNLGFVYIRMGRYVDAENQFMRSRAILDSNNLMLTGMALRTLHGLSQIYIEKNDTNRAETVLSQAIEVGRMAALRNSEMVEVLELYSKVLVNLSKTSEADRLHTEAARMRSELAFTVDAKSR
jgi:tetratricopeptide (TPR) repeat protein